nr:hypothetical protein CFP56_50432 [Quercus suber]
MLLKVRLAKITAHHIMVWLDSMAILFGRHSLTHFAAPKQGSSRQQRSAMISAEIKSLNRSDAPPQVLGTQSSGPQSSGEAGVAPGRMGDNESPEREGPVSQGLRGSTQPFANIDVSPVRSAEELAESASPSAKSSLSNVGNQEPLQVPQPYNLHRPSAGGALTNPGVPFEPASMTAAAYMRVGNKSSTIATSSSLGIVEDRLSSIPMHKMLGPSATKRIVRATRNWVLDSKSAGKKNQTLAAWRWVQGEQAEEKHIDQLAGFSSSQKEDMKAVQNARRAGLVVLKDSVGKRITDEVVRGIYPKQDLTDQNNSVAALNKVQRALAMNPSYLSNDASRVVAKVKSLLPAAQPAKPRAKAQSKSKTKA